MTKFVRSLMALGAAGILAGAAGFVVFSDTVGNLAPAPDIEADAIVVLTGDEERISTGVKLMLEGRARRLLISGVHPSTRVPTELKRRIQGHDARREALVHCCVDIGRDALNTSGNADEARQWAHANGFRSLIVVTSGYHMLRSLAEFGRAMPDVRLLPYPVTTGRNLHFEAWWSHWPTARLLAGEYVKFLGAKARSALAPVLGLKGQERSPAPPATTPAAAVTAGTQR